MNPDDLNEWLKLEMLQRELKARLKKAEATQMTIEDRLLDQFAEEGIRNIRLSVGWTIYLNRQLWARAKEGNYERACRTLSRVGLKDFVERRFNTNRLSAWVREQDKEGIPLKPALLKVLDVTEVFGLRAIRSKKEGESPNA